MHCLPHVINVVRSLLFGVGSCKKIFSSWVLASVLPNTLLFDKEGGFFCERLEGRCYQRLPMGKEKGTSAGLPCCLPTLGTGQDFAISAISHSARRSHARGCWLACSGLQPCWRCTQSSILQHWLSHNTHFLPPSADNHLVSEAFTSSELFPYIPLHNYMLASLSPVQRVWCLCAYVVVSSQPLTEEKSTPPALLVGCPRETAASLILQRKIVHCWGQ